VGKLVELKLVASQLRTALGVWSITWFQARVPFRNLLLVTDFSLFAWLGTYNLPTRW
jgi:hypothetical protein